jgi:hypothetical protein
MSRATKIVITCVALIVISILTGIARESAPAYGWIRIVISIGGFGLILWIWTKGK